MKIESFKNNNFFEIESYDENNRNIGYSKTSGILTGRNLFYPNTLIYDLKQKNLISPYDEKIMSLNKDSFYDSNEYQVDNLINFNQELNPVFFFIYNFDNYYHFLYDTIGYLYVYLELKKQIPELKILVNYPNPTKNEFYRFNLDILEKIININDLIIVNSNIYYKNIYISTSLTHGGLSNSPPRKELYNLYKLIKNKIVKELTIYPKRIYISRRTWINNDITNIGTNYTTRRKMINEDELVTKLNKYGIQEIFAENLSIDEKINIFSSAELIIGSIGGGMSNLLFSNKSTKSIVLVTPDFLKINYRFKFSMENTDITYFEDILTYKEKNNIPLYTRVKIVKTVIIGEICDYINNKYLVNLSNNDVAGFNNEIKLEQHFFNEDELIILDNGLNSPYIVNIDSLINLVKDKI